MFSTQQRHLIWFVTRVRKNFKWLSLCASFSLSLSLSLSLSHLNLFSLFFTLMLNFILDKPCGENHLLKCKTVDMLLWRPTRKQIMVLCFISKLLICSTLVWTWAKFLGFDSKLLLFQGIFSITLFMNKNILKATSPKSLQNIDQSHGSLDNSLMFTHNVIIETTHICDFGGISKQQQKQ